jgi:hypothetical protein
MKYALLIYPGTSRDAYHAMSEDAQEAMVGEYVALAQKPGVLGAAQLEPDTATTVRLEDSKPLITDGPFANVKEVVGGLYLLDAGNLDEALDFAAHIPAARLGGAVEVHRLVER